MKTIQLSGRLLSVADKVRANSVVADIGTDHAFIPIYLALNGISSKIYAADVAVGPLRMARRNIIDYNCNDSITLIQSDGLKQLENLDLNDVIIAGMGGETIISIIDNSLISKNNTVNFILQPMTMADKLRKWLFDSGFSIVDEDIVSEIDKLYQIIVAKFIGNKLDYDMVDLFIGPVNRVRKSDNCILLTDRLIEEEKKIISGLEKGNLDTYYHKTVLNELSLFRS